ncbi:MAG: hypothetical protein ACTSQ7_01120 [Alphaproteobacteria bacterium]
MPRLPVFLTLLIAMLAATPPEVWAQAAGELPCEGGDCPEMAGRGAWGLIVLGAMFFAIWFIPPRAKSEKGAGFMDSMPIMGALQRRMDKELSGWRRFQWPLIGLSFMALGFAFLFGWM